MVWVPGILINGGGGLFKLIGGALGIIFGPGSSVQDDGTGDIKIEATTAAKSVTLNGKVAVDCQVDSNSILSMGANWIEGKSIKPKTDDTFYCGDDSYRWARSFANSIYNGYKDIANADYTVTDSDFFIENTVNLTGNHTITLPSALISLKGWRLVFRQAANNGNNLIIASEGAQTFDGAANYTFTAIDGEVEFMSDGTNMRKVIDSGTDAPLDHAASHQDGGTDEISIAALSGRLADPQNADVLTDGAVQIGSAHATDGLVVGTAALQGLITLIADNGEEAVIYRNDTDITIDSGTGGILKFQVAGTTYLQAETNLFRIRSSSLKQEDSETYPLLIEDDTGAETGSISRSLTQLHVDSGTGGEIALDVATVEIASIDAAGVVIGSPAHQGLLTLVADNDEISTMLRNNDDFIIDSGAGGNMSFGLAGTSYLYLNPGLTTIRNSSLIQENSGVYPMIVAGDNGAQMQMRSISEEVTIVAGSGATGVLTTAFIPAGCTIKRILGRVTQAPGGGATDFDSCINGDVNKSIGDTIAVAVDTTFNNLQDGDGNRTDPGGQILAVAIKTTTDNNVTGTDMKIRYVVFYESFTEPTS